MMAEMLTFFPFLGLNESPSEKEGKCTPPVASIKFKPRLNESPSEKEGK